MKRRALLLAPGMAAMVGTTLAGAPAPASAQGVVAPASAQGVPSRPVRLVVPCAAAGPADVFGREVAEEVAQWGRVAAAAGIQPE